MREIEFRGKRIDNGEWVYGNLMQFEDSATFIFADERKGASTLTYAHFIINNMHAIDKKTIGQYTVLKDKNGKKIFEGDIVAFSEDDFHVFNSQVEYFSEDGYPAFDIKVPSTYYFDSNVFSEVSMSGLYEIEVIGNIHENPELLEEK
ncbi:TPA: YopX family protein [Listeria monocytogenes]